MFRGRKIAITAIFFVLLPCFGSLKQYLCGPKPQRMKPPHDEHITQEDYDAVCRDRDQWMQRSIEQHAYIQQLERERNSLRKQLGMKAEHQELFCRITKVAYNEGKAQEVEDKLRSACVSAPKLVAAIRLNEALGYLDTPDMNSKDLYDLLDTHFGLSFGLRAFQLARSQ